MQSSHVLQLYAFVLIYWQEALRQARAHGARDRSISFMEDHNMRPDQDIQKDVINELQWAPDVNDKDIAVNVRDAVVTLTGFVRNYLERNTAEFAVKRVFGVRGIANDIEVRLPSHDAIPDPVIAREALAAIRQELPLLWEQLQVLVHQGHITLEGEVEWDFQRNAAERAVHGLKGVTAISNLIRIQPQVAPTDIKGQIEEAFRRHGAVDVNHISVDANGGEVVLRGRVDSLFEREEAQRTAWSAPGVARVRNEILIEG
jgi:osmotically-inducible protein OsmY